MGTQGRTWATACMLALSLSGGAWAQDSGNPPGAEAATVELHFNGAAEQKSLELQGQEGHTVFETRVVPDTCYRQVLDHYERICHTEFRNECTPIAHQVCRDGFRQECTPITRRECVGLPPYQTCHDVSDRVCRTVPYRDCRTEWEQVCRPIWFPVCHDEPRYRSEAYACTKTIQVPVGYEIDYQVTARVQVTFESAAGSVQADETLQLQLDGAQLKLKPAKLSNLLLIETNSTFDTQVTAPKQKVVNATYTLRFVPLDEVLKPADGALQDFDWIRNEMSFSVPRVSHPEYLATSLRIARQQLVGEKKRFDGVVPAEALRLEDRGDRTRVIINLQRLGLDLGSDAKYNVELQIKAWNTRGQTLLNPELLPLHAEQELKQKGVRPSH